jgi:hypothetical protein
MQVVDTNYYHDMPFEEYQKLPGWSYSAIKEYERGAPVAPTAKMQIGTLVHAYLLEPHKYTHEHRSVVIPAAKAVREAVGDLLPFLQSEVSVTAGMIHEGMRMEYRGRVDMLRANRVVLDLKVSDQSLSRTIPFFGYDRSVSGYCLSTSARVGIIIRVCPKTYKTETKLIPISSEWWEKQILKFGKAL